MLKSVGRLLSKKSVCLLLWSSLVIWGNVSPGYAGRGCCSGHRGILDCESTANRLRCKDGTLSPTCSCDQMLGSASEGMNKSLENGSNKGRTFTEQQRKAIETAHSFLDVPYRYGGSDRSGMDCSGLISQIYPSYFASNERMTTHTQLKRLEERGDENIGVDQLQPGDVAYLKGKHGMHAVFVEDVIQSDHRPVKIIAASAGKKTRKVIRQSLGKDGSLGRDLSYFHGGRPR